MQAQLNLTFDLETAAGREMLRRIAQTLPETVVNLVPKPVAPVPVEVWAHQSSAVEQTPTDKQTSDTIKANRQQAAANARAAKALKQAAPAPGPVETTLGPQDDFLGPVPNGAQTDDQAESADDLGLTDPSMSPAEALEAALALLREAYISGGKAAEVKALQKQWQVAKFSDVPPEQGHELYRQVMKMAQAAGLRK